MGYSVGVRAAPCFSVAAQIHKRARVLTFSESIKTCLSKYIDFNGRASRSEYWWFVLLGFGLSFIPVIGWILRLVILLPSLAVQVRRLHDMDRSAWWLLLLVPPITIIGVIILLIMSIFPGTPGPNRYGPDTMLPRRDWEEFDYDTQGRSYGREPHETDFSAPRYDDEPSAPPQLAEVEPHTYCSQCGTQLHPDARFCTACGTSV